jgi:hypothetical protein
MLLWIRELEYGRSCIYVIFLQISFYLGCQFHTAIHISQHQKECSSRESVVHVAKQFDPSVTTNQYLRKALVSENEATKHAARCTISYSHAPSASR